MKSYLKGSFYLLLIASFAVTSCDQSSISSSTSDSDADTPAAVSSDKAKTADVQDTRSPDDLTVESMEEANQRFAEEGVNVRLAYAETVTKSNGGETASGQTIVANDREKQLSAQWVPGDERRNADGNNLTYLVDQTSSTANYLTADETDGEPAIDASFETWNNIKKNAKLNVVKVPDPGVETSYYFGGDPFLADIAEVGFLNPLYFEIFVGPGSSQNVLGVTFTFVFTDEEGNATDINNDGHDDIAFKEVWYNDAFIWTNDASGTGTDIETVALHENGHALGFGHFGKIHITDANNKLHVSPRSVMNAVILGTQRDLLGTDKASYNSVYGSWPKK